MNALINDSLANAGKALDRLAEVLERVPEDAIVRDAAIQRFEFTIEIMWKLLRRILQGQGLQVSFPKEIMQKAYAGGLIDDEAVWLAMIKDRNETSNAYDEALAKQIYDRIKLYHPVMKSTFDELFKRYHQL